LPRHLGLATVVGRWNNALQTTLWRASYKHVATVARQKCSYRRQTVAEGTQLLLAVIRHPVTSGHVFGTGVIIVLKSVVRSSDITVDFFPMLHLQSRVNQLLPAPAHPPQQ